MHSLQCSENTRLEHRNYEVTFWDFAGQDVYHVAHSLLLTKRTLYLVCVDLHAYTMAMTECTGESMRESESKLARWVYDRVFRWARLVLSRQPDAELVIVGTKAGIVTPQEISEVLDDLQARLELWAKTFQQEQEGPAMSAVDKSLREFHTRSKLQISGDFGRRSRCEAQSWSSRG